MKHGLSFWLLFFSITSNNLWSQQPNQYLKGTVENETSKKGMSGVHVINLNNVTGVITNSVGAFEISVNINDTLYFSYIGYKPLKIHVTNDIMKFKNTKFQLTELAYALEEVVVRPYRLTGYLEIDVKNVPINRAGRYKISGLTNSGYEAGNRNKSSISKALSAIFNPSDYLYNLFGKKPKQMKKLKQMRENDEIKNLLSTKFNREVLIQLLNIKIFDIEEILRNCNYSDSFIKEANDLQILEAISNCYEEYKVLKL
tara:strand:+ start:2609 stop:3379 length:771 start_codon:yes stop_codon:yes gene_type:complete